ncbi:hypothetical protein [Brevundimonas sp. M20]|uniref:hypothetical protein n=1 Tax=Brevundimonas sp. M20 TaxID=2591463 RepID=UPI0011467EE4|nr:hypothetical protein [Brevundimonas sp. M20]QDH72267.1 hypothetical protein FKQ52_01800 [Brevundimonas sp. M20]
MLRAGAIITVALLALAGCQRPAPPSDITGLLRDQGFAFLDIEPTVTISPLCSMQVGATRYDFFWHEWVQQNPVGAQHAAGRLIQLHDGRTYDGHYGALPNERPSCRPDRRQIIFGSSFIGLGQEGLPQSIFVDGQFYTRNR